MSFCEAKCSISKPLSVRVYIAVGELLGKWFTPVADGTGVLYDYVTHFIVYLFNIQNISIHREVMNSSNCENQHL